MAATTMPWRRQWRLRGANIQENDEPYVTRNYLYKKEQTRKSFMIYAEFIRRIPLYLYLVQLNIWMSWRNQSRSTRSANGNGKRGIFFFVDWAGEKHGN